MRRVLVTGASGRLGRAVLRLLAERGVASTGLDLVPVADAPVDRMVIGAAGDVDAVREALDGADAVVHCAAIPSPFLDTAERVFGGNSLATFTVLEQAARAKVTRAVLAGSQSILGFAFAPSPLVPAYLPIDDDHPLQAADSYALGKQADEATGAMMARRYGMTVITLRYPLLGGLGDRLPTYADRYRYEPQRGAASLWAYLEDRDAATAAWLALTAQLSGYRMFTVAAPQTLAAAPTEELLRRWLPDVPRRRELPGWTVPLDLAPATEILGLRPEYLHRPNGS
ncbi:nucleoside-diphosphate-sugar epimerase [Allocatelliglobosispora scoriae]|uniref:Nucleoside-diphosphate-sugar epimerase n=1 Tax=Allocatelliglobosispora scoriae TaxID=643052 RepID=A0A841BKR8_9ACTN|nr:NAD(P)-dependent oxidoreductase [Allocatelliglobosispora scoriae]MBB5867593.1 nucleoside-diphosphate-sugar epimerase [Allocatelliglobosispora scoriae]